MVRNCCHCSCFRFHYCGLFLSSLLWLQRQRESYFYSKLLLGYTALANLGIASACWIIYTIYLHKDVLVKGQVWSKKRGKAILKRFYNICMLLIFPPPPPQQSWSIFKEISLIVKNFAHLPREILSCSLVVLGKLIVDRLFAMRPISNNR